MCVEPSPRLVEFPFIDDDWSGLVSDGSSERRVNRSNSPFRYPGGKFYARRLILEEVPQHQDYCEPFAGGASVFFAKPKASGLSMLNDLDPDVVNTLTHVRDDAEGLIALLKGVGITRADHDHYKNHHIPNGGLERAFRWYYLNRTSYSGIMHPAGCYWSYSRNRSMPPERWPSHLRTAADKLQGVTLSCNDFETVIDSLPDGCFLFVDPPYYGANRQLYAVTFTQQDHERLAACLKRNRSRLRYLLTYDDHAVVRSLYGGWVQSIVGRQWVYAVNRTDDQANGLKKKDGFHRRRAKGSELFIRNYRTGRTQGVLPDIGDSPQSPPPAVTPHR